MNTNNVSHGITKAALTTLLFSLLSYSQAISQNLGDKQAFRVVAYKQTAADTAKVTVLPGSATGFMALLRQLGITNEAVVLQAGVALQTALEKNFPTYNKVITPDTKLAYVPSTGEVIVTFPDGNVLTATITGTAKKPQVSVTVSTQTQEDAENDNSNATDKSPAPIMYNATSARTITPVQPSIQERGVVTPIGANGVGATLKSTILQDYHNLPAASIANQAGLFIHNHLATMVGDTLPNNLYIQTVRDNSIGGLRVSVTQKTFNVEKTKTGKFTNTKSGKKMPVYKVVKTPVVTKIAEYGITHEGTKVSTYIIETGN